MLGFLKVISSSLCTVFCLVYMKLTSAQKCDIPWRRKTGGGPMVHHIVNAWCRENEIKD